MSDLAARLLAATATVERSVFGHRPRSPAEVLRALADEAEALGLGWDRYGDYGAVDLVEQRLVEVFEAEGAAFFPSGTMAQQAALRVWCDRAGTRRVAMPDLAHPVVHESDGPRRLHGFEVEPLTVGREVPTAEALAAVPGRLAAVLVELPLRDAGCRLPTWEELEGLSVATRERDVRLHVDGARIWEAQPGWDRSFPEIAALADSLYVSFYKGLGGLSGAALVGPADFLAEARVWRHRMGGTLYRSTPEALAALIGLRDELPRMAAKLAWARELAAELPARGLVADPVVPHTPTFLVRGDGDPDAVNERLLGMMTAERVQLTGPWRAGQEPGRVVAEVVVTSATLEHDPAAVADRLGALVDG